MSAAVEQLVTPLRRVWAMPAKNTFNPDGSAMSMAEAILNRISTTNPERHMPRNGVLTTAEKLGIRAYLGM